MMMVIMMINNGRDGIDRDAVATMKKLIMTMVAVKATMPGDQ